MLGDFEKMVVHHSSTTTNEWPQNTIDEKGLMVSSGRGMEKSSQDQQQQQQQQQSQPQLQPQQQQPQPPHLKCPRCDSANTKFCYYNNYSLSQPRHFCKACKRYWTRGGTLRNVPVGGGCRKNKRVKRPSEGSSALASTSTAVTNPNSHVQSHHVDLSSPTSSHMNPMFYGLPTNHSELNLPYPRLNSRDNNAVSGFNVLGLGFSSGLMGSDLNNDNSYRNGFSSTNKQFNDAVGSNPVYSSYPMIHGSSTTSNSSSTLASLIASSFQQQKVNNFQGLLPFENLNMAGNVDDHHQGGMMMMKDMKMEGGPNRFDWNGVNNQNQMQQINSSSDPSLWNTNGVGSWLDPSVPSLI